MSDEQTRQVDWILPPRSGGVGVKAVTSASASADISALAAKNTYVSFQADGGAVYVAFGATAPTVDDTATGTGATTCIVIPSGGTLNVKLLQKVDKFVAYKTASGTATLRYWQSAPGANQTDTLA